MMTNNEDNQKPAESTANESQPQDWEIDERHIDAQIEADQQQQQEKLAQRRAAIKQESAQFKDLDLQPLDEAGDEGTHLPCLNCSTPLMGHYCHICGQPERHFIRFFPKVLWEMLNEAFDLDSKIFSTLWPLIFSPGRLTMEYIAGRRARYVNPLRLYIITSILFFISISLFTNLNDNLVVHKDTHTGVKSRVEVSSDGPEPLTSDNKPAVINDNLDATSSDSERLRVFNQTLSQLKRQKAQGVPIPDATIKELEQALADGRIDNKELFIIDSNDDELRVTLDDGSEWHPITNPVQFNNWFGPETTQDLNNYLWELKLKLYSVNDDPSELIEEVMNVIPQLMFILLPLFALLLKIVYLFKKRYYMEHLIVALHSHSFIFLSLMLVLLFDYLSDWLVDIDWLTSSLSLAVVLLLVWIPINLFMQQKRIYAQGKFMTTIKFTFVGITYIMMLVMTSMAAFVLGLIAL